MAWDGAEGHKTQMAIKRFGLVVFGFDGKGEDRHFGTQGPHDRIPNERTAQPSLLKGNVNGQPAQSGHWNGRIAGETLDQFLRHIRQRNAAGRERIITRNAAGAGFQGHIARRGTATHVLADAFLKITVQGLNAATKPVPVVVLAQHLKMKRTGHETPNSC
jgi:hypothetical protein